MTLKTYYNRYIRNEFPNITFNDLAKFINIVLSKFDTMRLGYYQRKYAYVSNKEIDLENLPAQSEGGSSPVLIVFDKLINPLGYAMQKVTDYLDVFGEDGDNHYEKDDNKLKVFPAYDISGYGVVITVDATNETNGITFYLSGHAVDVPSGIENGQFLYIGSDMTGVKVNYTKITAKTTSNITVEQFTSSAITDTSNTYNWKFKPAYQVRGVYETTKLTIDSTLSSQNIGIKNELLELFNAMVFVEILSSGSYANDRLLNIWIKKLNSIIGRNNG